MDDYVVKCEKGTMFTVEATVKNKGKDNMDQDMVMYKRVGGNTLMVMPADEFELTFEKV